MIRVLFLTPWYPTPVDPSWGIFVREHARAAARHCEVEVLHSMGPAALPGPHWTLEQEHDPELTAGLTTYRTSSRGNASAAVAYATYIYGLFRAVLAIGQRGFRPDILHAHGYDPGYPAAWIGRVLRTPLVITEHYSAFPLGTLTRRQLRRARRAFGRAEKVLPVSLALETAIRRHGIDASFEVVPNAVDSSVFFPASADGDGEGLHRFLFVGRLDPIKGLPTLLEAAAGLRSAPRGWRLDLVGDGPARAALQEQAAALSITDRVTFHGQQPKRVIAELMRSAASLVLPSQWENAPCVVIEAAACGLPVIATRVGGIPELVDEEVGELVSPGSVPELRQALQRSLDGAVTYDRAAIARRGRAFDLEAVGSRLHAIYRRIMEP